MDYGKSFSIVFRDNDSLKKFLIGTILSAFSFLIIPQALIFGYFIEMINKQLEGQQELPQWNRWLDKFTYGVSLFIIGFIYTIPLFLIFIASLTILPLFGSFLYPYMISMGLLLIMYLFFQFFVLAPLFTIRLAKSHSIAAALAIRTIVSQIRRFFKPIALIALIEIGLIAIAVGLSLILDIAVGRVLHSEVSSTIAAAVLLAGPSFYMQLVIYHLYGQLGTLINEQTSLPNTQ